MSSIIHARRDSRVGSRSRGLPRRGLGVCVGIVAIALAGCGGAYQSGGASTGKAAGSGPPSGGTSTAKSPYGGGSPGTPGGAGQTLTLRADAGGALRFNRTTLTAGHAGTVTIVMVNPSGTPHAIAVEGNGVDKDGPTVGSGGTSRVTLKLKPGKYSFYCPVDGHEAAGMKGTLIVK